MKGKMVLVGVLFLLGFPLLLYSQSNEIIDKVLETEKLPYSLAVYLVLTAGEYIPDDASPKEAVEVLRRQEWPGLEKWYKRREARGDRTGQSGQVEPVRLGDYSYLIMEALGLEGGIMYRLFPGPRYASRELLFKGILDEDVSAGRSVSGEEALRMLRRTLEAPGLRAERGEATEAVGAEAVETGGKVTEAGAGTAGGRS